MNIIFFFFKFLLLQCMQAYVEFEISEGAYEISCPDASCPTQAALTIENDLQKLVSSDFIQKFQRYRLNRGEYTHTHT